MTALNAVHPAAPAENWDEDFVFQQASDTGTRSRARNPDAAEPRWSNSTTSRRSKSSISKLEDISGYASNLTQARLQDWAEPGPSSPPKHALPEAENWDDDFEDKADSPVRPRHQRTPSKLLRVSQEPENWDDDFEVAKGMTWESSDEEDGLGFADQEEDKTVTARSRKAAIAKYTPPPPVPPLPSALNEPFPRSPTMSVFSIPSGRESATYSSVAHLPLRAGSSSALGMLPPRPPSPPIHRERRRLRKKSRPPDHNVFELIDRTSLPSPPPPPSPDPVLQELPPAEPTKTPLLSRIGSVKKWGARKKRVSTGPAEVLLDEMDSSKDVTPRASTSHSHSPSSSSKSPGWFFRPTGGNGPDVPSVPDQGELKHERSIGRLKVFSSALDSPTKPGKKHAIVLGSSYPSTTGSGSTPEGTPPPSPRRPRRPASMQVPSSGKPLFPLRQASHGTMTVGRSASRSTFSTSTDDVSRESTGNEKGKEKEKDGHRSFMGGVRRISLVAGRHKRTKSTVEDEHPGSSGSPRAALPQLPAASTTTPNMPSHLLPPIELQPPSPPREPNRNDLALASDAATSGIESLLLRPSVDLTNVSSPSPTTPRSSPKKSPGSPQSASLGRSAHPPPPTTASIAVLRRNSLGDLKIPARISQAQVGLKRDLGMVRDFAAGVEQLKELQSIYQTLVQEAQAIVIESHPPTRATSPAFFSIPRPGSRARSNTNPTPGTAHPMKQFASTLYSIDHKYKISWECAELLIELGGGTPTPMSPPHSTTSAPAHDIPVESMNGRKSRERAVTLAGDESAPPFSISFPGPPLASPPNPEWRASTGRNDLSQRQLWLLRDMLHKQDSSPSMLTDLQIPEEGTVNRNWRWGDPMSSTITLPSEESIQNSSPSKKRRGSRLGMSGLRDMLRSLTRHQHRRHPPPFQSSSASASADSSLDGHSQKSRSGQSQRRRGKGSTGPESVSSVRASSPFSHPAAFPHHKSPRRPSLASIFRFSQKNKSSPTDADADAVPDIPKHMLHSSSSGSDLGSRLTVDDEEDWDRVESVEDLDAAAKALGMSKDGTATVRGRKSRYPYLPGTAKSGGTVTPKKGAATSQSSLLLWGDSPAPAPSRSQVSVTSVQPPLPTFTRPTRLSNVDESSEADQRDRGSQSKAKGADTKARSGASPHRTSSGRGTHGRRVLLTGSVRSAPPPSLAPAFQEHNADPQLSLSLTPENIRPLLDNAREVHARCSDCISELRALLAARA
ncbi:hypothetical protein BV25DRAFT_1296420 [Artomyces pyxidatus]|uniref:Uncharacterized protein n=1 Tax=Artomyces pyxidatus TaxID=48021 RepID=A0ACB8SQV5_9AGAM|nr:hypothetical protein BV25DRAFT_1296420 [Artomyces pyxidatus]